MKPEQKSIRAGDLARRLALLVRLTPLRLLVMAIGVIIGILVLKFMDSRDFIISCQTYSIESGITCPLK